jgi:putative membrane protein
MQVQWWCSAQDTAWTWTWRPYPGVWLLVIALGAGYASLVSKALRRAGPLGLRHGGRRTFSFASGLALLWIVLDWPVGALGAGYLASVHMVQFLLVALAVPPLLLLGLPAHEGENAGRAPRSAIAKLLTHPLVTLGTFTVVVIATHMPRVTDTLMRYQLGSFVIDMLWLGAGLLFWLPVAGPLQVRPFFSRPAKMGYLLANMILMTAPGAMITFSEYPIYALYELAPPVTSLGPLEDQRIAGLMMKIGGGAITWVAISVLFFRWQRDETRAMDRERNAAAAGGVGS